MRRHRLTLLDLAARMPPADARAAAAIRHFVRLHADTLRCVWPATTPDATTAVVLPTADHTVGVWAPRPRAASVWNRNGTMSVWPPGPFASTWSTEP